MKLKELIIGKSEFQFYKDSQLWYKTNTGSFTFPVPIEDIGNATFSRMEKSLLLMRYISKHLATLEEEKTR